jgi:hypothetical protein
MARTGCGGTRAGVSCDAIEDVVPIGVHDLGAGVAPVHLAPRARIDPARVRTPLARRLVALIAALAVQRLPAPDAARLRGLRAARRSTNVAGVSPASSAASIASVSVRDSIGARFRTLRSMSSRLTVTW